MTEKKAASATGPHPSEKQATSKPARKSTSKRVSEPTSPSTESPEKNELTSKSSMNDHCDASPEINAEMKQAESSEANQAHVSTRQEDQQASSPVANPALSAVVPSTTSSRILDVFLVDSGWNNDVGKAVRENLPVFAEYLHGQRFYVLSEEQSLEFIRKHPSLVGADPILIVLDREASRQKNPKGYGFRLCLGHMRNPEAAISMLKWAIQLSMASNGPQMSTIVKESGHRQTIQGTIELIGEGTAHLLEFAPV